MQTLSTALTPSRLSVRDIYRDRHVFILGATGFVGKVLLSMLLHRFPEVGRVYVMVRRGSGTDSEARFWNSVVSSPTFEPLREKYGSPEALAEFLREKVRVVDGDITVENLGMSEEEADRVAKDVDVVINSSGRVSFNPPLDSSLRTNVTGTRNVIAFVKRMRRPALIHTSTCFVAGNRSGAVWEDEELIGYFPRRGDLPGTKFSVEQELADTERAAARIRELADDAQVQAELRHKARDRMQREGRDPDDEGAIRLAVARERKEWIRSELSRYGMERAEFWGWPNIYCYTKSMGDQLVASETGIIRSIVRPAIVESAVEYPFRGWNEGFTTTAPLVYLALKGQNVLPVSDDLILDVVPVDHICAGMLLVAAQACVEQPKMVHQLSSGDLNPAKVDRVVTLTGLFKRKRFLSRETGNRFINELAARMEFRPVSWEQYDKHSIPLIHRFAKRTSDVLDKLRPRWGAGRFTSMIDRAKKAVDDVERVTNQANKDIEMFLPFVYRNAYIFRADNVRAIRDRVPVEEQHLLPWSPETLDWYDYWMNTHFPGLQKWVLPELDETYAAHPKQVYSYHDLLELFETTTKLHSTRVALRIERGKRDEIYTYADLKELATRAGVFLLGENVQPGDRILLFAKNGPEWSMSYFGVLKAGCVAVPVSHDSAVSEIVNVARASGAVGILIGDDLHDKRGSELTRALRDAGLKTNVWPFQKVFELPDLEVERERSARLLTKQNPDTVASLIFTSGTTGTPKGVMLTHRNFTFMVSELSKVFEFGVNDGVLSVLPLHHTFEFSTGLLTPLARGAQITYVSELNGEQIGNALKNGHVTAIVGVPAVWEALRRRVLQRFSEKSPVLETAVKALSSATYELRSRTGLDLGVLLFLPVHESFGGRIRYLISGGSALPPEVLKTFYGMGFSFFEGYGLTETAPVLTVTSPKVRPIAGSVGVPLPGVEVKIHEPDASGVGEIIARGRNIMAGYWEDEAATANAIRDGWFHTGDLGKFDEEGNLYIVGRSKEVIIDSNGKNVYPDEIEDLYRGCPFVKELSVVGLPDGTAEHVAGAVEINQKHDASLTRDEVISRIEEHFRKVSLELPHWKRIKVLHFWDGELPRTIKKNVKRRDVVAELLRLRKKSEGQPTLTGDLAEDEGGTAWLIDLVARVSGRSRHDLHLRTRLDALGFDSLMYAELAAALDQAGISLPESVDVSGVPDIAELHALVVRARATGALDRVGRERKRRGDTDDGEIEVPTAVAKLGKAGLALGQKLFYRRLLDTEIKGAQHIPTHTNFIVAANHSSHLDMGLIKVALGEYGKDITSLAAADYFFRDKYRRAYFSNFTNLVPMDRSGSIRKSIGTAEQVLRAGRSMIVFPEGTRSLSGEMTTFLPSLGYLATRAEVGILPAYAFGTYDALPKGAMIPKRRDVGVAFGPFLSWDDMQALTDGLPQQEGWRLIAAYVQRLVEGIRDGVAQRIDVQAARAAWNGEALDRIELKTKAERRRRLRSVP